MSLLTRDSRFADSTRPSKVLKVEESAEIAQHIEAFMARGGSIQQLHSAAVGRPSAWVDPVLGRTSAQLTETSRRGAKASHKTKKQSEPMPLKHQRLEW